jgi:hypothetical protein
LKLVSYKGFHPVLLLVSSSDHTTTTSATSTKQCCFFVLRINDIFSRGSNSVVFFVSFRVFFVSFRLFSILAIPLFYLPEPVLVISASSHQQKLFSLSSSERTS